MAVARQLLVEWTLEEQYTLRHWRGQWMRYFGPQWSEDEEKALRKWLYNRLEKGFYLQKVPKTGEFKRVPWQPNRTKINDLLDALASETLLPRGVDAPVWLDNFRPATGIIPCRNGLLDITDRTLYAATPCYFGLVAVPLDYDPKAREPVEWLKFLRSLWPQVYRNGQLCEAEEILALQQWFGYVLSGRTDLQKIFMLQGPKRSGKGTITRMLERLVGKGNHCSPTFTAFGQNFGLQSMLGKSLATITDARLNKDTSSVVIERLLSISGEDTLDVDRKYRDPWTGKLSARLMVCSNELPRFTDASGAIASRFIVLSMTNSFFGREDFELEARITAELPGILLWALDGLTSLNQNRRFLVPEASQELMDAFEAAVSPWSAFIKDTCIVGAEQTVTIDDLYAMWNQWAIDNGQTTYASKSRFGIDMRAAVPLRDYRPHGAPRGWRGVGFNQEWSERAKRTAASRQHAALYSTGYTP